MATFPGRLGTELTTAVIRAVPKKVQHLLNVYPHHCAIAGGFIRDASVRMPYNDVDIFCWGIDIARLVDWLGLPITRNTQYGITLDCPISVSHNTDDSTILWNTRQIQLLPCTGITQAIAGFDLHNCCAYYYCYEVFAHPEFCQAVTSGLSGANMDKINGFTGTRMLAMSLAGWEFPDEVRRAASMAYNDIGPSGG